MSQMSSLHRSTKNVGVLQSSRQLCREFAQQSTTHGVRRIADSKGSIRKFIWTIIFMSAVSGCLYHCSFIIRRYRSYLKVTSTQEVHAKELDFPALTVCNLNILKKAFLEDQMKNGSSEFSDFPNSPKGFCFDSEDDFLDKSNAKDLSDIWSKLGITSEHLRKYGHRVYDLIVQCTYNNKDCFNQSITKDLPLITENITIMNYTSTRLGLCHTIILNETTLGKVRRAGQTRGLTLTLNIERDQYLNLLSSEYGVRLMVHPRKAFPTIERGGIALTPGTKTYVSIKVREIKRLPSPYGECTYNFDDSPLIYLLKELDNDFQLSHNYYTYEYCQSLCRETLLLSNCSCVDEQLNLKHKFCNPCNDTQETCRTNFSTAFIADENNICSKLCIPSCDDIRYDMTLSRSEWPNMEFQEFVLKRWPNLISDFTQAGDINSTINGTVDLNETFINKNFLRVHIFIQEMNYLYFEDMKAYSLPEMFADLGGCLGLYIGVSIISMIEILELFSSILTLFYLRLSYINGCTRDETVHRFEIRAIKESGKRNGRFTESSKNKTIRKSSFADQRRSPRMIMKKTSSFAWSNGRSDSHDTKKDSHVFNDRLIEERVCSTCLEEIEALYRSQIFRRHHPPPITLPAAYQRMSAHMHENTIW